MTTKKAKAKKTVADVVEDQETDASPEVVAAVEIEAPMSGPDYHVTAAGDIVLTATGAPIPEDHPVHPAHRALAAARKYCK